MAALVAEPWRPQKCGRAALGYLQTMQCEDQGRERNDRPGPEHEHPPQQEFVGDFLAEALGDERRVRATAAGERLRGPSERVRAMGGCLGRRCSMPGSAARVSRTARRARSPSYTS